MTDEEIEEYANWLAEAVRAMKVDSKYDHLHVCSIPGKVSRPQILVWPMVLAENGQQGSLVFDGKVLAYVPRGDH